MLARHGYTISDNGVLVPNPGRHPATAGNARIRRVRVVKDSEGHTLKGKNGGARRIPRPADGEYLADKLVMRGIKRKGEHLTTPTGEHFAGALGTSVFDADAHEISAPRVIAEKHDRGMAAAISAAVSTGAIRLEDLDPKMYRKVMRLRAGQL